MEDVIKHAYLHSFIAFCYTDGKVGPGDLITPLVKKTIASFYKKTFTVIEIQAEIKKDFGKEFPLLILEREFHKLLALTIIDKNETDLSGLKYEVLADLTDIQNDFRMSQDETTFFLMQFREYLQSQDSNYGDIKLAALLKRLEVFCKSNMIAIIDYFGKTSDLIRVTKSDDKIDILIEDFFNSRVHINEKLMSEFERIFNGINLLYLFENCTEEISKSEYTIKDKVFYLDTNILLRILGLQNDYLNKLGSELLSFLRKNNFVIKVFGITINEMFSLLRGYKSSRHFFIKGKNISHVYQTLVNRGYEVFQIDDLCQDILEKLDDLNIEIDNISQWKPTDFNEFDKYIGTSGN
jgi:hypothetical protein